MTVMGMASLSVSEIALALLALATTAIAISALWPPFHFRRLVTAAGFGLVLISSFFVDQLPVLRLPLQLAIVADCAVLDEPEFNEELAAYEDEPTIISEVRLFLLPRRPGEPCGAPSPVIAEGDVERLDTIFPEENAQQSAIELAERWLDDGNQRDGFGWRWAAERRVLIAHLPGSLLDPTATGIPPAIRSADGNTERYFRSFGTKSVRHLRVKVAPSQVDPEGGRVGIFVDMLDPRFEDAEHVRIQTVVRGLKTDPIGSTPASSSTASGCTQSTPRTYKESVSVVSTHSLVSSQYDDIRVARDDVSLSGGTWLRVYQEAFIDASLCIGHDTWASFDVIVEVKLSSDRTVRTARQLFVPVRTLHGVTLITPSETDPEKQQLRAAPGWEHTAAGPGGGLNNPPGVGPTETPGPQTILNHFFQTIKSTDCSDGSCTRLPMPFLTGVEPCRFSGLGQVQSETGRFEACLQRTGRLVWISPTRDDLFNADNVFGFGTRVRRGQLDVMIAAPHYEPSDSASLSALAWVPLVRDLPTLRGEPRLSIVPTRRDSQRVRSSAGISGVAEQEAFYEALGSEGFLGPATEDTQDPAQPLQRSCTPGEPLGPDGALAWFTDGTAIVPRPATGILSSFGDPNQPHPERRLKGVIRVERIAQPKRLAGQRGNPGDYLNNLVCSSPWRRLSLALRHLKERGSFKPGEESAPRSVVALLLDTENHVGLAGVAAFDSANPGVCPDAAVTEAQTQSDLAAFFRAGGAIFLLPVKNSLGFEAEEAVLTPHVGGDIVDVNEIKGNLTAIAAGVGSIDGVRVLNPLNSGKDAKEIAAEFWTEVQALWAGSDRAQMLAKATLGDGGLTDRRDLCSPRLYNHGGTSRSLTGGCAFEAGPEWASALNRRGTMPEVTRFLEPVVDPFVSGRQVACNGEEVARSVPIGLGRVTALGYSPLSRDLFSADIVHSLDPVPPVLDLEPGESLIRRGQCYQQSLGRQVRVVSYEHASMFPGYSLALRTHGGLVLLERFAEASATERPLEYPGVQSITINPETGTLEVVAAAGTQKDWAWEPTATLHGSPEQIRPFFESFDQRTGLARFMFSTENPATGLLEFRLFRLLDPGAALDDVASSVMWVSFSGEQAYAESPERRPPFYAAPGFPIDTGSMAIVGVICGSFLMFSPLARRWRLAEELLATATGRASPDAYEQAARKAPLFSLTAGLAEWGMHPGRPAAIRSFGLPAGLRLWRSGDQGRAIRMATLFPMVAPDSGIPIRLPEVKLRTASEAADVLVLLEGSGAMLTPAPDAAPGKAVLAARFAAFLAHAVRLTHGVAEVQRVGREPLDFLEADETEAAILKELRAPPDYTPPSRAIDGQNLSGRVVYYICDGFSMNAAHLAALADELASEGSSLRVAAIISRDDERAVGLRRDPIDGTFDDDTETPPRLLLARRDAVLAEASVVISRRQGTLIVIDSAIDTQTLLEMMSETGFLN